MNDGPLHRLLQILRLLSQGERTLEELGGLTGVSRRTLYRYLRVLKQGGLTIRVDPQRRSYRVAPACLVPGLADEHLQALGLALDEARARETGPPWLEDLEVLRSLLADAD